MSYGERDPHYAYPDRQTARTYSQDELDAAVAAERERWLPSLRRLADAAKNVTGRTFAPWIDELDAAYREAKAKIEKA